MTEHEKIKFTTKHFVNLLIGRNHSEIESLTESVRLRAEEISKAIDEYSGSFIMPLEDAFDNLDVIKISGKNPSEWSVVMNLWTIEEGQSDLSIELTIIDNGENIFRVEFDNIHVR
ncbi:MAG: hypothetical protein M3T96_00140 [Acidobacteriota bacterium]|nr:hypothetical protein [Acidobacteriota bacterium]